MQHELALEAAGRGEVDVVDAYTTDAQIDRLHLVLLEDDRHFFPRYDAVFLYRSDLAGRVPRAQEAILALAGRVSDEAMRRANSRVVIDKESVADTARALLRDALDASVAPATRGGVLSEIAADTTRHLILVAVALLLSILVGIPLGVLGARSRPLAAGTTTLTGILQTIPSLALLALMIPLFGIGATLVTIALFLYGLLPIVRATMTGIASLPGSITDSAVAIGLPYRARLARVLLPLASPHILAGIRTSAVVTVGTATIAALVGAGGLGDPILQGITLRDGVRVLEGAVPAALLALAIDGAFAALGRWLVPKGLRV
jgi:osmoprotectant transport system permease protein